MADQHPHPWKSGGATYRMLSCARLLLPPRRSPCILAGKRLKETNVMLNNMIETIEGVHGSLAPLVLHASSVTEVPSGVCTTHAEWVDLWGEGKSFSAKHLFEFEMMALLRRFALVAA